MRRILVVEDEQDLGEMIARFLKRAGYDAVHCLDGAAAWSKLQKEGADLVLTDLNMPVMDGLELVQRLRADPRFHAVPVLMLTVKQELDQQVEGYEIGADDYMAKPFDFPVLLARLKALERRTLGASPT